jgi:hypothetical protein
MYEAFAWLEYCVAKGFNPERFKQSVIEHLKRSRQKDFTWKQIDERIYYLWCYNANRKAGQSKDHSLVYRVGIKALDCFGRYDKRKVRARVEQMMSEPIFESFKRAGKRSRRKRTAKPTSRSVEVENLSSQKAKRAFVELPLHSTLQNFTSESSTVQVSCSCRGSRMWRM